MKSILLLIICALISLNPLTSMAEEQANGCHCFRNRKFNPSSRFKADDYLLATSFNSLIAATLKVSKKQIIMQMMKGGIDPDNLLMALYIAHSAQVSPDLLLAIKADGGTWQMITRSQTVNQRLEKDPILTAISNGEHTEAVLSRITAWMLNKRFGIKEKNIAQLKSGNFTNRETVLIVALHKLTDTPINLLIDLIRNQKMSWSEIAHNGGLSPTDVGKAILSGSIT